MTVGDYLVDIVAKVCLLPDIVFTEAFFTVFATIFFSGFLIRIIIKMLAGV